MYFIYKILSLALLVQGLPLVRAADDELPEIEKQRRLNIAKEYIGTYESSRGDIIATISLEHDAVIFRYIEPSEMTIHLNNYEIIHAGGYENALMAVTREAVVHDNKDLFFVNTTTNKIAGTRTVETVTVRKMGGTVDFRRDFQFFKKATRWGSTYWDEDKSGRALQGRPDLDLQLIQKMDRPLRASALQSAARARLSNTVPSLIRNGIAPVDGHDFFPDHSSVLHIPANDNSRPGGPGPNGTNPQGPTSKPSESPTKNISPTGPDNKDSKACLEAYAAAAAE